MHVYEISKNPGADCAANCSARECAMHECAMLHVRVSHVEDISITANDSCGTSGSAMSHT